MLTKGRERKFTDHQLRQDLLAGMRPVEIAAKYGASRAAVSKRVSQLEKTTISAAVAPAESQRFVSRQLDALGQLTHNLDRVNRLLDACHEWLSDPDRPEKYHLGPRAGDVTVAYKVEVSTDGGYRTVMRKKPLDELLGALHDGYDADGARFVAAEKGEYKHADPRELILRTAQEARQTVQAATDLAKMLADARAMQEWRKVVLEAIGRADPDVRDAIIGEIRSSLTLRGLLEGTGATPEAN